VVTTRRSPSAPTTPRIRAASSAASTNNVYLLRCRRTDEQVLIDAANDAHTLLSLIGEDGLARVVTTHQHQDHWQALGAVAGANGANTAAHPLDAAPLPVPPDFLVEHGDTLTVGDVTLSVIHLRGHTPGSIALLYRDPAGHPHLFTGDSLFPGGVGKTAGPTQFTSLLDDVERKLFGALPDDTWFYPGHGDDSTLGRERPALAEWRARGW